MSKIKIVGHASGSGVLTIAAPNTNTDRTITIPDVTGTLLDSGSDLPAANLTGTIASARLPTSTDLPLAGGTMTGAILHSDGSTSAPSISFSADTNTGFYRVGSDKIGAVVGGSLKTTITSTGLGIGTTAPLGQLQVGGSTAVSADSKIIFGKSTAASQDYLPVIQQSSTGGVSNDLVLAATSGDGAIRMYTGASSGSGIFGTTNNAERLRIDKDGNVTVSGTVDGRDVAADGTKLDGIEASATADQTAAQIKTHLENGIDSVHYVNGSIDREHLAADIVDGTKIANDAINSEHYVDGSIDNQHISGMAASKLSGNLPAISGASLTNLPTPSLLATPGAVGSYTMGYHISNSTAARAAGYTFAGSLLKHTYGHGSSSVDWYPASMSMQYGQPVRSLGFGGTWKAMYAFRTGNWTSQWYYVAVLCQRIS